MLTKIRKIAEDSLYVNSFYLIVSTGVLSALGFLFWIISARLTTTENIGIATALISVMSTISIFSLFGFDSTIVRFLANSPKKNNKLNTSLVMVAGISITLSSFFIIFANKISPQLSFIKYNTALSLGFVIFTALMTINILTDAVFLSYRQTRYTLIINVIFSLVKMFLPLVLYTLGSIGIFLSVAIGQAVGSILSILVMIWKFEYKPRFVIDTEILGAVWRFSLSNYLSGALNLIPTFFLPILIINRLGTKESAYFYIVTMIMNLLYAIPTSINRSLFAEGSYDENSFNVNIVKVAKTLTYIIVPAVVLITFVGDKMLSIFGENYSAGHGFLIIMSISTVFISINSIINSFFRIKHNLKGLLLVSFSNAISIIGLSYLLISKGLLGIGFAWTIGSLISSVVGYLCYRFYYIKSTGKVLSLLPYGRGIDDRWGEFIPYIYANYAFVLAFIKSGFKTKTVIFYPQKPWSIHSTYRIFKSLGYKITNNPKAKADVIFNFEDTTIRNTNPIIESFIRSGRTVINSRCNDISKENVERIFSKVFGYGTFVDPETFKGTCVQKSDENALHDGKIVDCPRKREAGYIYQKFINTEKDNTYTDLRLIIMDAKVCFVVVRNKRLDNPFDNSFKSEIKEPNEILSENEISKVSEFCKEFGLDYGEIDSLRDKDDNKLYLVDANNTPGEPRPGRAVTREYFNIMFNRIRKEFISSFLAKQS